MKVSAIEELKRGVPVLMFCFEGKKDPPAKEAKKAFSVLLKSGLFSGKDGEIVPAPDASYIFCGAGKRKEFSSTKMRIITRKAVLSNVLSHMKKVQVIPPAGMEKEVAEGILIGGYVWDKYKSEKKKRPEEFYIMTKKRVLIERTAKICEGVNYARNLVNEDANVMNSLAIEKEARKLASKLPNMEIEVLGESEMKKMGLNLILAVNRGSQNPPRLIIIKYSGGKGKYTAFAGKGITYDSGGLGIKPGDYMRYMRDDMGGVGALLGVLKNVIEFRPKKNLIFALAVAENAVDSRSYKMGEIVKSYDGKTVEIAHTDAEGRLALADAIAYVRKKYSPERIIDIATLTGAAIVGLGNDYMALMSTDDETAEKLLISAEKTDDRAWRLPIYPELAEHVKSMEADIKNLGYRTVAGALSAGEFLRQFAGKKWSHLDIAGPVFVEEKERWYYGHGATGAGVRLLTDFILNRL